MPVVHKKANAVANADNMPPIKNSKNIANGTLKESVGTVEVASGDSIGSTYRLARVRSSERISQILLSCDAITGAAGHVGIYDINGGAAVDADFFALAQSFATALVNHDITHQADPSDQGNGFGREDVEKPLWQALGLAKDPVQDYDIAVTLTAAATSAGTISLKVRYV